MPQNKKQTTNKKTQVANAAKGGKKNAGSSAKTEKKLTARRTVKKPERVDRGYTLLYQAAPYILIVLAVFFAICLVSGEVTGVLGEFFRTVMFGLLSGSAVALPLLLGVVAFFMIKAGESGYGSARYKFIFAGLFQLFLSVLVHLFTNGSAAEAGYNIKQLWTLGSDRLGGGVLGGVIGNLLLKLIGPAGSYIVVIAGVVIFGLFLFGLTPKAVWIYISYYIQKKREERAERVESNRRRPKLITEEAYMYDDDDPSISSAIKKRDRAQRAGVTSEEPLDDAADENAEDAYEIDAAIFEEALKRQNEAPISEDDEDGELDLNGIFADEDKEAYGADAADVGMADEAEMELSVERKQLVEQAAEPVEAEKPAPIYAFPPITMLHHEVVKNKEDISGELNATATKLVETLRSFKVRTTLVNVSRGPTITRYELSPEEGVRVRAITNLVDDIALNLATSGVRIEAPIPGKQAVGIEVPNRTTSTVYLRELIDDNKFKQSQSKLTASLGKDVAGEPVYLDIAKMPHLLIAGATGSGKSVCINSMIMSLLYKATPDEVKLIMIDPKKVELSIYNGLPHLLVPVVSEPKKAAGALAWAVTEMERRFELIEQCGVRNIKNYNLVIKDDPQKDFMPQIVIIIDELADLMMTAPDDVENSICRLAQKGRAAGMHLIIGTQRPSVDVVTGLIKANVPSRIAFAVSSITDSRVILDYSGAEKLIGKGDMLFAPIGALKPIRVQGSFVSENEVEEVVEFIKEHMGEASEYDSEVISTIEREAAKCGQGKKSQMSASSDDDGEGEEGADPMLKPAIELAVESGKISTSLIQRKLSLGYGRAAKLIDKMERMGIVSAPEGQKPRNVLISKQDYMEMVLKRDDIGEGE